jgi:cation-transporting P-type ATPase C
VAVPGYSVVHEVPGRLRLRVSALADPALDAAFLGSWLEAVQGVEAVRINRGARSAVIEYAGGAGVREAVLHRLGQFSPAPLPGLPDDAGAEAAIAPMVTSAASLVLLPLLPPPAQKLLTFAVVGSTLVKGADTLIRSGIKVEVLDALAVGLSATRGEVYTATVTGFLLALGEYLERRTERQSDRLLRGLLRPEPAMAWVERDGGLVQVPGDEVRPGEQVTVGVGETIPVDGRVIGGSALVNQAAITGEDVPVRKEAPKRVVCGSLVVEGRLRIEATDVGEDTTTARVARFIQESLSKRSDTQRLADKRVYLTLGTGGLVYALTRDLTRLESVFLVDYSCALKLGTPVAFKSGMSRAAGLGILMKGGGAIEHLAAVDTVVFDKTGTLTKEDSASANRTSGGCISARTSAPRMLVSTGRTSARMRFAGRSGRFVPGFSSALATAGWIRGAVAQLGERRVRNAKVRGSIPLGSTKNQTVRENRPRAGFFVSASGVKTRRLAEAGQLVQVRGIDISLRGQGT